MKVNSLDKLNRNLSKRRRLPGKYNNRRRYRNMGGMNNRRNKLAMLRSVGIINRRLKRMANRLKRKSKS